MRIETHVDVCSGIGGFALAARWSGIKTIQFVEIDTFCQAVLRKNFPGVPIHADAETFDARPFRGRVGLFTAGFPCQPHSIAGKKKGKADSRNLWPCVIRLIRDCQPVACLLENVSNLANTMLDEVLRDLAGAGYETEVYCVAAEDIGAPHERERLWIVAYSELARLASVPESPGQDCSRQSGRWSTPTGSRSEDVACNVGNPTSNYRQILHRSQWPDTDLGRSCLRVFPPGRTDYRSWAAVASLDASLMPCIERPLRGVASRVPKRVDGLTGSIRNHQLRALGNAIVPQIAYAFMLAICNTITKECSPE